MLGHIRLWAHTDWADNGCGITSLHFARALLRFAPVRLISLTGVLEGQWQAMDRLLTTPMVTPMINVVCATPNHWAKSINVGMPEKDGMQAAIATGKTAPQKIKSEAMTRELWTLGVRNVLIALDHPDHAEVGRLQASTANRYDAIIVPQVETQLAWSSAMILHGYQARILPVHVPIPVQGDSIATLRSLVMNT